MEFFWMPALVTGVHMASVLFMFLCIYGYKVVYQKRSVFISSNRRVHLYIIHIYAALTILLVFISLVLFL